jgi:hypothetical protein
MIFTVGVTGCDGAETVTTTEELFCHRLQGMTFGKDLHLARMVELRNRKGSPTLNSVLEEDGKIEKVWSSIQTHRVVGVKIFDSRS